jgi:hypothetical protein
MEDGIKAKTLINSGLIFLNYTMSNQSINFEPMPVTTFESKNSNPLHKRVY